MKKVFTIAILFIFMFSYISVGAKTMKPLNKAPEDQCITDIFYDTAYLISCFIDAFAKIPGNFMKKEDDDGTEKDD